MENRESPTIEAYWEERYASIDISKSGHVNLPATYNTWLYRRKKDVLCESLRDADCLPGPQTSVLEIAAGSGTYVQMWQSMGVDTLTGIDISQNAVLQLQKQFPDYRFRKCDVAQANLSETTGRDYDLVTVMDVLYYIPDNDGFRTAFRNLAQTVRSNGWLAIHDVFLQSGELQSGYRRLRSMKAYLDLLESEGFEVISCRPTFFFAVQARAITPAWMRPWLIDNLWSRITLPCIRRFPEVAGRATYWLDSFAAALFNSGPSYWMVVCQRLPDGGKNNDPGETHVAL